MGLRVEYLACTKEEQAHDIRTSSFSFAFHRRTRCNYDVEVESVGKDFVLAWLRSNHLRSSDTDGNMIQAKGMFCIEGLCTRTWKAGFNVGLELQVGGSRFGILVDS